MIKQLEQAIEKVKALPAERQALAAAILEQIAADPEPFDIPDEELAAVQEGLAQADRGDFASDAAVDAILRKPWR